MTISPPGEQCAPVTRVVFPLKYVQFHKGCTLLVRHAIYTPNSTCPTRRRLFRSLLSPLRQSAWSVAPRFRMQNQNANNPHHSFLFKLKWWSWTNPNRCCLSCWLHRQSNEYKKIRIMSLLKATVCRFSRKTFHKFTSTQTYRTLSRSGFFFFNHMKNAE